MNESVTKIEIKFDKLSLRLWGLRSVSMNFNLTTKQFSHSEKSTQNKINQKTFIKSKVMKERSRAGQVDMYMILLTIVGALVVVFKI